MANPRTLIHRIGQIHFNARREGIMGNTWRDSVSPLEGFTACALIIPPLIFPLFKPIHPTFKGGWPRCPCGVRANVIGCLMESRSNAVEYNALAYPLNICPRKRVCLILQPRFKSKRCWEPWPNPIPVILRYNAERVAPRNRFLPERRFRSRLEFFAPLV